MAKWMWRFLNEPDSLWVRVVKACKREMEWNGEGLVSARNGVTPSGWWNKVVKLCRGEGGKWFQENLERRIGNGHTISFWHQRWAGNYTLRERFQRLFRISCDQGGLLKDLGSWIDGVWEWRLNWTRPLRGREEYQANELIIFLSNFSLNADLPDAWLWKATTNGIFSVKSAYFLIKEMADTRRNDLPKEEFSKIWKAPAPHKMKTNAWRILKGRMATCENLARRQIQIPPGASLCSLCKAHSEDSKHLFFSCPFSMAIWSAVLSWLGIQTVHPQDASDHFNAFTNLGKKSARNFLASVWIGTTWCIWKNRNECVFNHGSCKTGNLVAEIKMRLWSWSKVYKTGMPLRDFKSWSKNLDANFCF